ncbi:MAG: bifunctional 5,10-methylene-tetrahydrofolate dehydrogenase/5,10-methylene-tetrahydrofolate cyclohydrolase [Oscillospiraceae bacterium]|nr:bifunctional 5,10-methylene-tetrahydrofolate dehydrogenase/5,10-methylene-tetrahydrofolate cyclohydrolase [Oscillospiraceae bacterium]
MAEILKGAPVAAAINEKTSAKIAELAEKGIRPCLAVLRVGLNEADESYIRGIMKRAEALGVEAQVRALPEDAAEDEVLSLMEELNEDKNVHGVLMMRPLPKHIDEDKVRRALKPEKDMDGITDVALGGVFSGNNIGYAPCTAQSCIEILDHYGVDLKGKKVCVIGRSLVIGKPVSMMALGKNATVTICHSRTENLAETVKNADVVIAAVGKAGFVTADMLREGQKVIDVGINVNAKGKLCGDVDFAAAENIVSAVTPVPGGVGAVTTAVLMCHLVDAAGK